VVIDDLVVKRAEEDQVCQGIPELGLRDGYATRAIRSSRDNVRLHSENRRPGTFNIFNE
jgi:hypothetical protein